MTAEFNPYDDDVPVGERLGSQRLGGPPEVAQVVPIGPVSKPARTRQRTPRKGRSRGLRLTAAGLRSKIRSNHRELASTCLEIGGMTAFSAGFWLIHIWLGLMVSGLCLVLLGVATSNRLTGPRD